MGDTPAFVIKGDTHAFVMGDGMGDVPAFMIIGDTPLAMCVSFYLCNRRRVIGTHVSLLSQKRAHLRYKLNRDVPKRISSPFYPPLCQFCSSMMWTRLIFSNRRRSHLRASPICVSDLSFLCSDGLYMPTCEVVMMASTFNSYPPEC
jgi:hypothetical protein